MRPRQLFPKIVCDESPCPALGTPCHVPRRYHQPNGYVLVVYSGQQVLVHRYIWEREHGPIPKGLMIDHVCMNKACCNADHLRLVSPSVNALEHTKRLFNHTHCPNGHPKTPENYVIRQRNPNGRRHVYHCLPCKRQSQARYEANHPRRHRGTASQP